MTQLQNTKMVTANMLIARQKKSASVIKVDYSPKQKTKVASQLLV